MCTFLNHDVFYHEDINECLSPFCDVNAACLNTFGSVICICNPGFNGDGRTCTGKMIIRIQESYSLKTNVSLVQKRSSSVPKE